jgi:hypothetical protein
MDRQFMNSHNYRYLNKSRTFLKSIGIPVVSHESTTPDPSNSFMTGCWIDRGVVNYVAKRCLVGSLLHEAGHLALTPHKYWTSIAPGCFSNQAQIKDPFAGGGEFAVEAWGYAAASAIGIPVEAAVHSSAKICSIANDNFEIDNQPNYFGDITRAEFAICMDLLQGKHLGIKLLRLAGMAGSDYPNLKSWIWGDRQSDFNFESIKRGG